MGGLLPQDDDLLRTCRFPTDPSLYRHCRLATATAPSPKTLTIDVDEHCRAGCPGTSVKLNSSTSAWTIELYAAVQRLRFEPPWCSSVVVTSGKDKYLLLRPGPTLILVVRLAPPVEVNFCKFTNETRNGIEDGLTVTPSGQTYLAASTAPRPSAATIWPWACGT